MSETNWSAPETEVLASVREVLDADGRGVLVTVVSVEGSAYRRPGAKMVIRERRGGTGHVTPGCLEKDIERLAAEVRATREPQLKRYDLTPEDDDDVWGLGIGCNGVIDLLFEPIDESYCPAIEAFEAGDDVGVITVVDSSNESAVGSRAYYRPEADAFSCDGAFPSSTLDSVRAVVDELTRRGRSDMVEVAGTTLFVDGFAAPSNLVVVGTGHDIDPLVELAAKADFRVTVVGYRGASNSDFPKASEFHTTSPARLGEVVDFDADTYVVVATHNFVDDRLTIETLFDTPVPYVGLMGPRDRFEAMLDDFAEEGRQVTDAQLERIFTPVGLHLGGGSPHQIALSIVAELLAIRNNTEPRHLKERTEPIHTRIKLPNMNERRD